MPGFPIRTPWDHSSVDSSPRPIAASHVLHRLLVPRHPPCALGNLTTKMLASTVQFSNNNQPQPHQPPHTHTPTTGTRQFDDQAQDWTTRKQPHPTQGTLVPSGPNRMSHRHHQPHHQHPFHTTTRQSRAVLEPDEPLPATDSPVSPPMSTPPAHSAGRGLLDPPSRAGAP